MSHYGLSVSTTFTLRPTQSFFLSFVNETTYVSIIRQRSMTLDSSIWRNSYLNLLFLSCVLLYQMLFLPEVFCHSGDLPPQICTISKVMIPFYSLSRHQLCVPCSDCSLWRPISSNLSHLTLSPLHSAITCTTFSQMHNSAETCKAVFFSSTLGSSGDMQLD